MPKAWNDAMELVVQFEINSPDSGGRRYNRPYVAVWIEDKDGSAVRTLSLWYQQGRGNRWLPDLKRWFRGERMRQLADGGDLTNTVSSATRMPGRYSVVWNGRDDQNKPVGQGEYFVCVEAAREHGTYQLLRKNFVFENRPVKADLGGNIEIKSATIAYDRRK